MSSGSGGRLLAHVRGGVVVVVGGGGVVGVVGDLFVGGGW